mgnify:CR=1 FL=1
MDKFTIQPHGRLNDWVADEKGYFADEGLDYFLNIDASYKTVDSFAKREVAWLLEIGGITIEHDKKLGRDLNLTDLTERFDAVFLAIGLAGVNALGASGQGKAGVRDAVDFIAELRQAETYSQVPVGRDVVVIGGGLHFRCHVEVKILWSFFKSI